MGTPSPWWFVWAPIGLCYNSAMSQAQWDRLKRGLQVAAIVLAAAILWFLPDVVAWLNRQPDEAWARVQQSGAIKFAIDPSYMPFDGLGSHNDFFGIDVDLATQLARRLGLRAEFVVTGRDSLYDVLTVGQADATLSALNVDPARAGKWRYSTPYFDAGPVFVWRGAAPADYANLQIAVELGSAGDAAARHWARRHAGVTVLTYETVEAALQALSRGEAGAALVDAISARELIPKMYADLVVGDYAAHDPLALAVWGESVQLLDALNRGLADMQRDGTLDGILAKWLQR